MNLEPSRQDKPQEMDLASLGKAMEKVLPPQGGVDPKAHYARIQDFLRQVQAGEENRSESPLDNKTLDATSLSMFLPSFLETSMDETGALGSGGKSSAEKRAAELEEVFKVIKRILVRIIEKTAVNFIFFIFKKGARGKRWAQPSGPQISNPSADSQSEAGESNSNGRTTGSSCQSRSCYEQVITSQWNQQCKSLQTGGSEEEEPESTAVLISHQG